MVNNLLSNELYIVSGSTHIKLAESIVEGMGLKLGALERRIHPNGELYVRYKDSVRGKHAIIIQPNHCTSDMTIQDSIWETALLADAAKSASASEITVIAPYLGYSRQDRKAKGREPIGTRVVLKQLENIGVNRIVTVDLHSPQSQAIFNGPFDHITAHPVLRRAMIETLKNTDNELWRIVAPDAGAAKMANRHGKEMGVNVMHMVKSRDPKDSNNIIRDQDFPEAKGKICILYDDMIDTAGTLVSAAEALKKSGAKSVYVAATHGIFSDPASERLALNHIDKIIVTDSVPTDKISKKLGNKLEIVSIAPIIGATLHEILTDGSVSNLFDDENHQ